MQVFNDSNPSGNLVENALYSDVLRSALFLSIMVAIKRFFIRMHLDQQTYHFYGPKLAAVTHKIRLILEVINWEDSSKDEEANTARADEAKTKLEELLKPPKESIIAKHQFGDASIRAIKLFHTAWALLQKEFLFITSGNIEQNIETAAKKFVALLLNGENDALQKTYGKLIKAVHDEYRLLQAIMDNASQIDHSFEKIVNVFF